MPLDQLMPKKKRNVLALLLKLTISGSVLAYIFLNQAPVQDILREIKQVDLVWILASFSLHALGVWISAVRWQILIQAQGEDVPLGYLAKSYLVGTFFNNFLPTRFGGDLVRIYDGSLYSRSILKSSAVVLVERLTGVFILLLFALGASLIRLDMAREFPIVWISILCASGGLVLIFGFLSPFWGRWLSRIPDRGFLAKLKTKSQQFRDTILVYRSKKKAVSKAMGWAFLLQVNVIVHYYLAGKGLHLQIPFLDYFIFIPIILLILTIPITISGWGLREGIYIQIFGYYAIPAAAAVSFPLIADAAFTLLIGLIGAAIFVTRKKQIDP